MLIIEVIDSFMMQEALPQYNNFGSSIDFDIDQQNFPKFEFSDTKVQINASKSKDSTVKMSGIQNNVETSNELNKDGESDSSSLNNRKFEKMSETSNSNSIKTKVNLSLSPG